MFSPDYVVPGLRRTGGVTYENNGVEHGTIEEALTAARMQALAYGDTIDLVFNGITVPVHGDSRIADLARNHRQSVLFYARGGTKGQP